MKERADKVLAERGLVSSRSQAKSLIEKGDVSCAGHVLKKASELIDPHAEILIHSPLYVGRGAFKLEQALKQFPVTVSDKVCLDIGASTGGFTEVLLQAGAKKVYAIDVGHGQLADKLIQDPRVINLEKTNIRELNKLPETAQLAVMDVSFISVTKVLSNIHSLLDSHAALIALIKPQFEAGLERLPKDGVVKDARVQREILNEVITFATSNGWIHLGTIDSPIEGKDGNKEFLCHLVKSN